jgi:hypothetical protein
MKGVIPLLVSNAAGKIFDCPAVPVYMMNQRQYGALLQNIKDTSKKSIENTSKNKHRLLQQLVTIVTKLAKKVSEDKQYLTEYVAYLKQVQKQSFCKNNFDKYITIIVNLDQSIKYKNKYNVNPASLAELDKYVLKISTYIIKELDVPKELVTKIAQNVKAENNI